MEVVEVSAFCVFEKYLYYYQKRIDVDIVFTADFVYRLITDSERYPEATHNKQYLIVTRYQITHFICWFVHKLYLFVFVVNFQRQRYSFFS